MNTSALSKVVNEVRDLADVHARLQISDWTPASPLRLRDTIREATTNIRTKAGPDRNALIRLACLCIIGVWILDLEGGSWPKR